LPALPVPGDPEGLSERILEKFREPFHVGGQEIHIHISIGISRFPDDGKDGDTLVKHADVALYHAKEKGKNSHEFFKPAMNNRAVERIAMENGLRRALKGGEFALYYQPEVDCEGRICGLESLLRWNSPDQGLVFPARIIHLAEKTGLMAPLGDWILREACRQAEQWCRQGLTVPLVSVNLSATQFHNGKLVESIARILEEERITPDFLELEITESTAMRDINHSLTVMRKLKKMGVRLALDDFGTGHSSLGYLKKFPIDTLKIDQLFIRELLNNGQDRAIVLAILLLARSLNMRVVAEGVESRDQFLWLQKAGCDGLQGYLFGEAAPADRVTETLRMEAKASLAPPPRPAESKSAKLKT
ncbi:MAG TPA: GGDEF domain-containing phosphodiesterase, partial [bacterium]|nr:GGDEF domain-containing phosphodiesterase [bacterium]